MTFSEHSARASWQRLGCTCTASSRSRYKHDRSNLCNFFPIDGVTTHLGRFWDTSGQKCVVMPVMDRTGKLTVEGLMARIAALQAENCQLTERIVKLEEELALARLHRFAPKSVLSGSSMKPNGMRLRVRLEAKMARVLICRTPGCCQPKSPLARSGQGRLKTGGDCAD